MDPVTQELSNRAFDFWGPYAFAMILLIIGLGFMTMLWVRSSARVESLHEARLNDAREVAKIGEAMRDTMAANTAALLTNNELVKSLSYRGRDAT